MGESESEAGLEPFVHRLTADATAVVGLVGCGESIVGVEAAGERSPGRAVRPSDRFDLASLTKPVVATLALALDRAGRFHLDERVGERFANVPLQLARRSWRDVLRHRGGFVPWAPLYRRLRSPERVFDRLASDEFLGAPAETYSDLGYIFWGLAVERALGEPLFGLLRAGVFSPLGMLGTVGPGERRGVAECSLDNGVEVKLATALGVRVAARREVRLGVAQDGNARFLGRVCGHAGLWGPAEDLWRLGREWLRPGRVIDPAARDAVMEDRSRLAFGWRRRRRAGSGGLALSKSSFGHPGFTGTSLWIDPEADRVYVLLAHRRSTDTEFDPRRREFHRLASRAS